MNQVQNSPLLVSSVIKTVQEMEEIVFGLSSPKLNDDISKILILLDHCDIKPNVLVGYSHFNALKVTESK